MNKIVLKFLFCMLLIVVSIPILNASNNEVKSTDHHYEWFYNIDNPSFTGVQAEHNWSGHYVGAALDSCPDKNGKLTKHSGPYYKNNDVNTDILTCYASSAGFPTAEGWLPKSVFHYYH